MNMSPQVNYASKNKRQPLAKLASEAVAPPEVSGSIIAECPPVVKRRGRPRKYDEESATISFRVPTAHRQLYVRCAAACRQTLSDWAAAQLKQAARPSPPEGKVRA